MLQKKAIYPLKNYRTPGFYGSLFLVKETRLMTTGDRSQCPELISYYDFNGQCPRVKFVYHVNKYLLVPSLYPPEASGGYFGLAFATPPPPCVERFLALTL